MIRRASIAGMLALAAGACGSTARSADAAPAQQTPPPSAASTSCGGKSQPDCPLQSWMKSTLQTYQREKDYTRLASSLEKLANHAPAGYGNWKELALAGAKAAEQHDDTAISKNCKGCHNEHRTRFRKEQRATPMF